MNIDFYWFIKNSETDLLLLLLLWVNSSELAKNTKTASTI